MQVLTQYRWTVALAIYILAAWFSTGFHHYDEHFQILEFANLKMGKALEANMPWEYKEQMRAALQPFLTVQSVCFFEKINCTDPFIQTFLLRLIVGLLTLGVLKKWSEALTKQEGASIGNSFGWCVAFLWCMPYLSVRYSSEGVSNLCFLAAALIFYQYRKEKLPLIIALAAGLLLGLSFEFRFQMAFAILGVLGWLFFVDKRGWISVFVVSIGILLAVLLGTLVDHWFYNEWVFVPYNYLNVNLLQGKAGSIFGVMPFWWYIPEFIARMAPPVSVVLLLLAIKGFKTFKNHILIWAMVPFVLVHFMIGHKELRFLFPALAALVLLAAGGWEQYLKHPIFNQRITRKVLYLTGFINFILLIAATFRPASDALPYYQFLYETAEAQGSTHLIVEKKDPYEHVGLPTSFYKHPNLTVNVVESIADILSATNNSVHHGDLVLLQTINYQSSNPNIVLEKVYCYYPDAIKWVNFGNWQSRTRIWTIYRVKLGTKE